ncbi:MAG TPA: TonB C-terminal domain-containing protein [Gemmatimonadaceae bacterium]|nr:TonB C-terminal domain-containing protein [Gemmatimonadaceae bacterium]
MRNGRGRGTRLAGPFGVSLLLHAGLIAALVLLRPPAPPARPPIYRVNIVAAPPGPRAAGVVTPPKATPAPEPKAPPPTRAATRERAMPMPDKTPPKRRATPATPVPPTEKPAPKKKAEEQPKAGGGPTGGRGTDVATVRTEGVDFPFPGYLENIVRQIALRFHPPGNSSARAEVMFLIRRDGSVTGIRFLTRSGDYAFDLEAQGAVEQAGQVQAFGPLPSGFSDDVLPVIFSFDPRVLR